MFGEIAFLRFGYETELLVTLTRRYGPIPLLDYAQGRHLQEARRRDLLGDAVRVTEDLLPEVHRVYRDCLAAIGGPWAGELFVCQSAGYNAGVFAHGDTFDLLVHSALVNAFSPDELRFVFGHELGHVVFQHAALPIRELVEALGDGEPAATQLLLRWSRAAEVSADRVGMLCCGQLGPAASALFRTASGLSGVDDDRVLRSLRGQYDALEAALARPSPMPPGVRSHPMIPIRFKAMELAALDIIALGRGTGGFSGRGFRQVDRQIAALLERLEERSG
jgi:Zn-dependent protease with chaperone function